MQILIENIYTNFQTFSTKNIKVISKLLKKDLKIPKKWFFSIFNNKYLKN